MFSCFLVSDPSEILVDWAKLSIDIDVQEGDTWFLRAVKQDLGQTFRRGGHIEVDDITVMSFSQSSRPQPNCVSPSFSRILILL